MSDVLKSYKSRRNQAQLVQTPSGVAVRKIFAQKESFLRELAVYRRLESTSLPSARIITAFQQTLLLTPLPGMTMLEVLESQEQGSMDVRPWNSLVRWLLDFSEATGLIMADPNLRNFLWDGKILTGVDFEECIPGEPARMAARLAAYIRTYNPENTPVKKEISAQVLRRFSGDLGMDPQDLFRLSKQEELLLLQRRSCKRK